MEGDGAGLTKVKTITPYLILGDIRAEGSGVRGCRIKQQCPRIRHHSAMCHAEGKAVSLYRETPPHSEIAVLCPKHLRTDSGWEGKVSAGARAADLLC